VLIDSNLIVALGGALAAILGGVGAVLAGINKMHAGRIAALEKDLADERTETARLTTALTVSRAETDVARGERDKVRQEKDDEIHRIEAARRADRLQHEADMQARTAELRTGGQQ